MSVNNYDTGNLRSEASFKTLIFPSIEWVPFSKLGKTRFTNAEMNEIIRLEPKERLNEVISNPYELIQYLQQSNFVEARDLEYVYKGEEKWECHKNGISALKANQGSCSSLVSVFHYVLQARYNQIGSLCIISNSGNGHALNYIQTHDCIYIIDLFVQMNVYASYIPVETGKKADFVRTKYITGGCLKTNSINSFIRYFEKYNKKANKEFLFFTYTGDVCPPVFMQRRDGNLQVVLSRCFDTTIINEKPLNTICVNFEERSDSTWKQT